ncbi:hypothetical protein [Leisingera sp. JC11]|uniref:hypothetical protein n=1 Tax=Leisingera sp. JC11 TaxID=3042469 RepID=UPI003453B80D
MAVCEAGPDCSIVCQTGCICVQDPDTGECLCDCSEDEPGGLAERKWGRFSFSDSSQINVVASDFPIGKFAEVLGFIRGEDAKPVPKVSGIATVTLKMTGATFGDVVDELVRLSD